MPEQSLFRTLLLPELSLTTFRRIRDTRMIHVLATKRPRVEVCPNCATPSTTGYDRRRVQLKDESFRGAQVRLFVDKRRLWCKSCRKPFTVARCDT